MPDTKRATTTGPAPGQALRALVAAIRNVQRFLTETNARQNRIFTPQLLDMWELHYGVVHSCNPASRVYQVINEDWVAVACVRAGENAFIPFGVYDASTLQPNTPVLYATSPKHRHGWILAALPPCGIDAAVPRKDTLGKGTGISYNLETAIVQNLELSPGPGDYSGRSLVNSLEVGEFCRVAETGLKLFLDSTVATLQADEVTGLWAFYWDQLCRLSGVNLQLRSSGWELESYDDAGGHVWYEGSVLYPHEQWGCYNPEGLAEAIAQYTAEDVQLKNPRLSACEPAMPQVQAFHRLQTYRGLLGNLEHRFVVAPPQETADGSELPENNGSSSSVPGDKTAFLYAYDPAGAQTPPHLPLPCGLWEQQITPAGTFAMRSATGIHLIKQASIPVPRRRKLPADPSGGSPKVDGLPEPKMLNAASGDEDAARKHVDGILDLHSYLFQHAGLFPFEARDFECPAETDVDYEQVILDYKNRAEIKLAKVCAYLSITNDGDILISDGAGSEIRMSRGQIRISAAKEVFLESAGNVMAWAGKDLIFRCQQDCDLTSSAGTVRVKAEENLMTTATWGNMIMDARAGNVAIRAPTGKVLCHGGDVYIYACYNQGSESSESSSLPSADSSCPACQSHGEIILDAADGCGIIRSHSRETYLAASCATYILSGQPEGWFDESLGWDNWCQSWSSGSWDLTSSACYTQYKALATFTDNLTYVAADLICNGRLAPKKIAAEAEQIQSWVDECLAKLRQEQNMELEDLWELVFVKFGALETDIQVCPYDVLNLYDCQFHLREETEYYFPGGEDTSGSEGGDKWRLSAPRWSYMNQYTPWVENPVPDTDFPDAFQEVCSPSSASSEGISCWKYPYPGRTAWTKTESYLVYQHSLLDDVQTGRAKPAGDPPKPEMCDYGEYEAYIPDKIYPNVPSGDSS